MTKFFVKRPYFVVVAVIIVLVLGGVSTSKMKTDLLPDMDIPYLLVVETYPGATAGKVEKEVTEKMEGALGTVSGVENIRSTSADNYAMIVVELADDTDMNAALVRVSKAADSVELPEGCGKPNIMELGMDMMATLYASVEYDGKDIKDLTDFAKNTVKPEVERKDGVANVNISGVVEDSIEIRLDKKKVDKINEKILNYSNDKLKESKDKLDESQSKLDNAKSALDEQSGKLKDSQSSANNKMADASIKLDKAQAARAAYEADLMSLQAQQAALTAEKNAYKKAKLKENYKKADAGFATMKAQFGSIASAQGIKVPGSIKEAINNPDDVKKLKTMLEAAGQKDAAKALDVKQLKKLYNIVNVRMPQLDTELANLKIKIKVAKAVVDKMKGKMKGVDDAQSKVIAGGYQAASQFGSADAQIAAGKSSMDTAQANIDAGKKQYEDAKAAIEENANIKGLLSLETLSALISAQNFSMPAGYVKDKNDDQWLVKVGDEYNKKKQLDDLVLTKVKGVGKIKLSDVAKIVMVDNLGDSYAKLDGKNTILLSVFKTSTANTSDVSKELKKTFKEIEDQNKGVKISPMVDQAEYISKMIDTILTSILLGAALAILVLILFLKSAKPTVVVAFSIPFSVLFALIIMYFTGITINLMSLAGLCLGIGMLVDNSIVVIENIYRLIHMGYSRGRAAVQGTKQVSGAIVASTLTTICVFMPMVYVTGTVAQLLMPFAFAISYALAASLIVAMTVVPTMGYAVLRNTKPVTHKAFDKLKRYYGKSLKFCLKFKVIPLAIAIILLVISVAALSQSGMEMMGNSDSDQIMMTVQFEKGIKQKEAYKRADEICKIVSKIDGVKRFGGVDGNTTNSTASVGVSQDDYSQFIFFVVPEDNLNTVSEFREVKNEILEKTKKIKAENISVDSSMMGGSMMSSGMEINIYGKDNAKLIELSNKVMDVLKQEKGLDKIDNGITDDDKQIHVKIDKNKAAKYGLTVAQIFQQLSGKMTTEKDTMTLATEKADLKVVLKDEMAKVTKENILDTEVTATTKAQDGSDVNKKYKLKKFATLKKEVAAKTITRKNQDNYLSVTAETKDGYNTTLISRNIEKKIKDIKTDDGYSIEIEGEVTQVSDMMKQLAEAILLGLLLIYLIMVAQFQNLLSPFIILFTVPLAFTGGMFGLLLFGDNISAMAMMGFMILMGTVVNNGIVFVDFTNKLRLQGIKKKKALIQTGKDRMRPILMTAMTTILSMSVMVLSNDAGQAMQKPMAIVVCFGLIYATFMTLYIVPVLYDIFYRKQPRVIDVGEGDIDEIPDETEDVLNSSDDE